MRLSVFVLAATFLAGCAGGVTPPAQPTISGVSDTAAQLAAISGSPETIYEAGAYQVRVACDAYLNQQAARSANLSLAGTGIGIGGAAAAGFLMSGGNPAGAAAAGVLSSIGQSFLSAFQNSGALPYSTATASIIQNALAAYDAAVVPPQSAGEAMLDVEGLWWQCSPGGYAQLMEKAAMTATVSAGAPAGVSFRAVGRAHPPQVLVNGR